MHKKICIDKKNTTALLITLFFLVFFIQLSKLVIQERRTTQTKAVFGGGETVGSKWPFMVLLYNRNFLNKEAVNTWSGIKYKHNLPDEHYCGGTLIDSQWVLTAAHCLVNKDSSDVAVAIGFNKTSDLLDNENTLTRNVQEFFTAPLSADIALLRLDSPVPSQFKTLSLSSEALMENTEQTPFGILGWGQMVGGPSINLRLAVVPLVSNARANKESWGGNKVSDTMIAAGYPTGGASFCYGDSGGPLILWNGNRFVQSGVLVWSRKDEAPYSCGLARSPTISTRISSYISWISKTVSDHDNGKSIRPNQGTFVGRKKDLPSLNTSRSSIEFAEDDKNNQ